jgi:hypothetical protein
MILIMLPDLLFLDFIILLLNLHFLVLHDTLN